MHDISSDGQSHKLVPQRVSRRQVLALAGAAGVGWMLRGALGQAAPGIKPSLHVYTNYGWLRGFSIVPSWGARIEEAWWSYDGAAHARRSRAGRRVHANCLRLWIEFSAWMASPNASRPSSWMPWRPSMKRA